MFIASCSADPTSNSEITNFHDFLTNQIVIEEKTITNKQHL